MLKKYQLPFNLCIVLIAFAANSILCRLALKPIVTTENISESALIDPIYFTIIRLLSGAIIFILWLVLFKQPLFKPKLLQFKGAFYLFIYALTFSFAYIAIDAASGALVLFGTVQLCIIITYSLQGSRLSYLEWIGSLIAIIGLFVLTLPKWLNSSTDNTYLPIIFMVISGIVWGLFTVNGAKSKKPTADMAYCFILTIPMCLAAFIIWEFYSATTSNHNLNTYLTSSISLPGSLLAILSGAITSAMGYALWYKLLPLLSPSQASTSQLLVPIFTAIGGYLLLSESLGLSFFIASSFTLGGFLLVIYAKKTK